MPGFRHLVVVLPGIGGSVLERPPGPGRPAETVWDAGFGAIDDLVRRPGRLDLGNAPDLRPAGLIRSRQVLPGLTAIHGYEKLRAGFAEQGATIDDGRSGVRVPGADVVFFPYDFRRSVAESAQLLAAEVHERLKDLVPSAREGRVVVLAHSMGGLVARYWLGPLGGWPLCRALITLGTPHRGAPKALRWTVDGVRLAGRRLDGPTELIRGWPAVAELLPRYPAVWDAVGERAIRPHELPIPSLAGPAKRAYDLHLEIESAWREMPRGSTVVLPRIGWSHATVNAMTWDGMRLIGSRRPPAWLDLGAWHDDRGDGTVPAFSALPTEMDATGPDRFRVRERHGPLGGAPTGVSLVMQYERFPSLAPVHGYGDGAATLGLSLDEAHPVGDPVPVRAEVLRAPAETAGADAWATVTAAGAVRPLADVRLEPVDGGFAGALTGLAPGLYDLTVRVRGLGDQADLRSADSFAVLAG